MNNSNNKNISHKNINLNNNKKFDFSLIDFPIEGKKHGKYFAKYPYQAANKAFTFLCENYKFYDNLDGQKYLKFSLVNNQNQKIYTFIGTIIKLVKPIISIFPPLNLVLERVMSSISLANSPPNFILTLEGSLNIRLLFTQLDPS